MTNPGHLLRSTRTRPKERSKNERHSINMNTQMGSSLPSEKLDRSNYLSWEYKMNQFLVHQGHWSYIKAAKAQSREGNKDAKAQNREGTKPRRHKAAKNRATKPRKATKATKPCREDANKAVQQSRASRATAQQSRASQTNRAKAKSREEPRNEAAKNHATPRKGRSTKSPRVQAFATGLRGRISCARRSREAAKRSRSTNEAAKRSRATTP